MNKNPIEHGNDDSKNKEEDHHQNSDEQVRKVTYADVVKRHGLTTTAGSK